MEKTFSVSTCRYLKRDTFSKIKKQIELVLETTDLELETTDNL